MMAIRNTMARYASMIAQLREVPPSKDGLTLTEAMNEAADHAVRQRLDMAVGLGQNDTTGEPEWNYCPLVSIGPAFVLDVRFIVTTHGLQPFAWFVDFDWQLPGVLGMRPLDDGQMAALLAGKGYVTAPNQVLQ